MALFLELIIVPYFWTALFPGFLKDWSTFKLQKKMGLCMDHSLPFLTLVIEFFFLSGTPIVLRHFSVCVGFAWIYLIFNCIYTLSTFPGSIYKPFRWDSVVQDIALPVGFTLYGAFIYYVAHLVAKCKLKKLGHKKIYKIINGNNKEQSGDEVKAFIE